MGLPSWIWLSPGSSLEGTVTGQGLPCFKVPGEKSLCTTGVHRDLGYTGLQGVQGVAIGANSGMEIPPC